jgi:hypothetical protein
MNRPAHAHNKKEHNTNHIPPILILVVIFCKKRKQASLEKNKGEKFFVFYADKLMNT